MNHKKSYLLTMLGTFILGLFFSACGTQPYLKENTAFIFFKTPSFKYADMGFIYENSSEVKVETYSSGQALMSLEVSSNSVCMSQFKCMSKKMFNRELLSSHYSDNILENIFRGKAIFNGENIVKKSNGFTQRIIKINKYHIEYSVLNRETVFSDTINNIVIKIRKQ